ncbi:glucooligosaccharide oxidase [Coprinopsis cinerea okayama7|uniref:Glucooligosaccharide oxidase n=1 Tax=Coprinopsis cinerea (strain Okayama-7 / 130 / ATCC MYA-4618 / FGSC 9003) TaxID=240176 RepID=A8N871_COPC7|nr:glucooligosaccharide oxidase [Coprinopsis cinerea okayama7\|eukprot:XP_001831027.1 glucooligosaccharide oxidase [Coprinopsis cinerea okayama7\
MVEFKALLSSCIVALSLQGSGVNAAAVSASASLHSDLKNLGFNVTIPNDTGYSYVSAAFNLRYQLKPAAVAFPSNTKQVADVVRVAARHNYKVVSRSGGHSYAASGLGGKDGLVVLDLRHLNAVKFDSASNRATIGPGTHLGELATSLGNHNRVLPHGTCPLVAVGGHAAFGGYGFMARKHGLLADTVQEAEVVLANGTVAVTSKSKHPDLFWAIRGSAPSFGIVTSITSQTFPMPPSTTTFEYGWTLSPSELSKIINHFQHFVRNNAGFAPELSAELYIAPDIRTRQLTVSLSGAFYDSPSKFQSAISGLINGMPPVGWSSKTDGTYLKSVEHFGQWSWGKHDTFYAKSLLTPADELMTTNAIDAFTRYLGSNGLGSNTNWFIQIGSFGGPTSKINQFSADESSFAHRDSLLLFQFYGRTFFPPFPASGFTLLDGMVDSIVHNSPAGWKYGAYTNYVDDRLANWQHLYYGNHYPRLQRLKTLYDPNNVFSFPTSISA